MALMLTVPYLPDKQVSKQQIVKTALVAAVDADGIALYAGEDVSLSRQVEIINGWRWLWNGIRDRHLLDGSWVGSPLYSGADINALTEANRRTNAGSEVFTSTDIILGIGLNITALKTSSLQFQESGFQKLREYARENWG